MSNKPLSQRLGETKLTPWGMFCVVFGVVAAISACMYPSMSATSVTALAIALVVAGVSGALGFLVLRTEAEPSRSWRTTLAKLGMGALGFVLASFPIVIARALFPVSPEPLPPHAAAPAGGATNPSQPASLPSAPTTPVSSDKKQTAPLDPRAILPPGSTFESNDLAKLIDTHFPNARYQPTGVIEIQASGKQYVVETLKLNDVGSATYKILTVTEALPAASPSSVTSSFSERPTTSNSDDVLNSCFLGGKSLAAVYLANATTTVAADLLPSSIMREGCAQKAGETSDPRGCIHACELGFRKEVKDELR